MVHVVQILAMNVWDIHRLLSKFAQVLISMVDSMKDHG